MIDPSSPNTPTAGLALQNGNIIYASVAAIRFVPPNGAVTAPSVRTIATASSRVSTLNTAANGVFWGEQGGAVRRKVGPTITTLQPSGLVPTSISANGTTAASAQAWTQCGSQTCQLRFIVSTLNSTRTIGADALGVTVVGRNIFWGDAAGVHRLAF
ncbi:MAG TPA: hypothetical protein VLV54_00295 [Thermoanaerobaculia bacterium]|nr:hypothetical protein [Thermoanaerobaculia bacterium]